MGFKCLIIALMMAGVLYADSDFSNELIEFMKEVNMTFDIKLSEIMAGVIFTRARRKFKDLLDTAWNKSSYGKFHLSVNH